MKNVHPSGNSPLPRRMRCLLALIAAVILVIVVSPSESLLASATHQSAGHGEVSPPASEADPAVADRSDRWAEATPANLDETVPGPGAFLGTLLKELAAASAESDAGIKKLVAGIPQVFPDLNKVLVAL